MKVSKPPSGSLAGPSAGPPEVKHTGAKSFSEKLARAAGTDKTQPTAPGRATATASAGRARRVSDIASALQAGQITPEVALNRVVERIIARQLGPDAPAAVKQHVSAALRQTLEDDPTLAAKIRALGQDQD
jgi:hypothetical protein